MHGDRYTGEIGGLSGRPLQDLALHALKLIKSEACDALTIIGVGGIDSAVVAQARLDAGANLLQIYTGLIYQGPELIKSCSGLSQWHSLTRRF